MQGKFYSISPAVGTKETGSAYPAVESFEDYDFNGPYSVYKLNHRSFPDFEPEIRFKLSKTAKPTDLLSQATINAPGLLASARFIELLPNLETFRLYKGVVLSEGQNQQFYWIHTPSFMNHSLIDFNNSQFYYLKDNKREILRFKELKSFIDKRKELGFFTPIKPIRVTLHDNISDLFVLPFSNTIYVSEELAKTIRELSGIELILEEYLIKNIPTT